jgi:hypothetical protein
MQILEYLHKRAAQRGGVEMGVLLALSTLFIWGRLVNIDDDLKDISKELKKMNERKNDGR